MEALLQRGNFEKLGKLYKAKENGGKINRLARVHKRVIKAIKIPLIGFMGHFTGKKFVGKPPLFFSMGFLTKNFWH